MAVQHNIDTQVTIPVVRSGWNGKPKGILQILYERGYIDKDKVTSCSKMRYSMKGRKGDLDEMTGEFKNGSKQFSLTYLMSKCTDFKDQKTDIDQLCDEISLMLIPNSTILFTPKYHCELAGGVSNILGEHLSVYIAASRCPRRSNLRTSRDW